MAPRLDQRLLDLALAPDLITARGLIMAGRVLVDDRPRCKPGEAIGPRAVIRLKETPQPWVSRGGLKLVAALDIWNVAVTGLVCLDAGASTGGFTDVLVTRGAARVYALDVGYGQLAWKLASDPRVVVMDRCNVRHLKPGDLAEAVDLLTADLSFISLAQTLPAITPCLKPGGMGIVLIKPQFELEKAQISKGGVVTDPLLHQEAIESVRRVAGSIGLTPIGVSPSPVLGPAGNREFLFLFHRPDAPTSPPGESFPVHD